MMTNTPYTTSSCAKCAHSTMMTNTPYTTSFENQLLVSMHTVNQVIDNFNQRGNPSKIGTDVTIEHFCRGNRLNCADICEAYRDFLPSTRDLFDTIPQSRMIQQIATHQYMT